MENLHDMWPFPQFIALLYALPRMLVMFSLIPMLNRQTLPGVLRIGVATCLALTLVPALTEPAMAANRGAFLAMGIILKEAGIGLAMGFMAAIPLWVFESMGAIIDMQRGASMAEALNPLTGHEASPLGHLFSQASIIFMFALGGFGILLSAVYESYMIWPIFDWWPHMNSSTPTLILGQLDRLTRLTVLWASPVICVMFLAEIGLALVSRFAPQLQVFFLAMPIKSGIAFFTLSVYIETLFAYSKDEIRDLSGAISRTLSAAFS
jgi:type III secretion protein T